MTASQLQEKLQLKTNKQTNKKRYQLFITYTTWTTLTFTKKDLQKGKKCLQIPFIL